MIATELKKLKRIHTLLLVSLVIMISSQLFTLLTSSLEYLVAIAISAAIVGAWFYYNRKKNVSVLKQLAPLLIFLIAVLGPILYVIYQVSTEEGISFISGQMFSLLFFVLPIALLLLATRWLSQLISEAQSL